ncbi:phenazine biosynthesis protein PhzF family protein [Rhizoctonia solani AG-3 Rhs1AP]|uniref:Phenazine biosynthesis protein PhzF family protein n=2 Tax=Rhizoctonia solani AG-3 TaxID=1086053 RepID=A0A074SLG7_9AGAM|nr:phenazine biosynthesis protein PhzF family protein [Rhizoctonia solani AG-3 Rhs1AP]KEP50902.1 phenazine biosynthesis protein PhzF family protein [Rhizoctonia solani 123E]
MIPRPRVFMQVDVFASSTPLSGNPVAVVLDSAGLSSDKMREFAAWTNLAETTFVDAPNDPSADYKLRIFSITQELPFAGHPTLGSCKAWLESGGVPKKEGEIVQECGIGLVVIKLDLSSGRLNFAAPGFLREGKVSTEDLARMCDAMSIHTEDVLASRWIDNGPGWAGLLLKSASDVLAVKTDRIKEAKGLVWGIIGAYPTYGQPLFELRAFDPLEFEDPVTGSLNAGVGKWLISWGLAPQHYVASQGTCLEKGAYMCRRTILLLTQVTSGLVVKPEYISPE